jgi:hypothetical protein
MRGCSAMREGNGTVEVQDVLAMAWSSTGGGALEQGRRCGGSDGEVAHGRTAAAWAHAGWERTGAAGRAVEGGGGAEGVRAQTAAARRAAERGGAGGVRRRTTAAVTGPRAKTRGRAGSESESEVVTGQERNMTCGPR